MYQLQALVLGFRHVSRGTTIAGVTKKQLTSLPFWLPTPEVQQGRTDAIERRLSLLRSASESLDRGLRERSPIPRSHARACGQGATAKFRRRLSSTATADSRSGDTGGGRRPQPAEACAEGNSAPYSPQHSGFAGEGRGLHLHIASRLSPCSDAVLARSGRCHHHVRRDHAGVPQLFLPSWSSVRTGTLRQSAWTRQSWSRTSSRSSWMRHRGKNRWPPRQVRRPSRTCISEISGR